MNFGARYADVYDSLYQDKNYAAEALFALRQVRSICTGRDLRILDLGCGTGLHALELAQQGLSVTGIDRSADMIQVAERRRQALPSPLADRLRFQVGDIRTVDLHEEYDAVLSLFHVICYMTGENEVAAAFGTAYRHLKPGGAFVFDFWHEAAVLHEPPQRREKTISTPARDIHRSAVPEWDPTRSLVRITYDMEIRDARTGETVREREEHLVRYFSPRELEEQLNRAAFKAVRFGEWLTDAAPSDSSFGVFALARAQ